MMFRQVRVQLSIVAVILLLGPLSLLAVDIHVSSSGKDTNPGLLADSLQVFAAARACVAHGDVTIHVTDGIYDLT